jgi:uncharacterized protein YhfF
MTGYDFHPETYLDLDSIWDFIAENNADAADKVVADILAGQKRATAAAKED